MPPSPDAIRDLCAAALECADLLTVAYCCRALGSDDGHLALYPEERPALAELFARLDEAEIDATEAAKVCAVSIRRSGAAWRSTDRRAVPPLPPPRC